MRELPLLVVVSITLFLYLVRAARKSNERDVEIIVEDKPPVCNQFAAVGDIVQVHYTGRLESGQIFDTSEGEGRQPLEFELGKGRVIKGWEKGIKGMCVGEKRQLIIPPHLAYGSKGVDPVIPPDATLIFSTELVNIQKKGWIDISALINVGMWPALICSVLYYLYKKVQKETAENSKSTTKKRKGKKSS